MSKASEWERTRDFPRRDLILSLSEKAEAYPVLFHDRLECGIKSDWNEKVFLTKEQALKVGRWILDTFGDPSTVGQADSDAVPRAPHGESKS
jgi:hypothetical protein